MTIVNQGERILGKERPDFSQILMAQLREEGIRIINKASLIEFTSSHTALIENEHQEKEQIEFDAVLMAVGRVLNLDDLKLDKAGIKIDKRGSMILDDYLRTTNKHVFASGDAAGKYQFSHGAEMHTRLLAYNFKHGFKKSMMRVICHG